MCKMELDIIYKVFNNDYIMLDILRLLNLKEQCLLRDICPRLKYLINSVWLQDAQEIQMNRIRTGGLTTEEFTRFLRENVENIKKLAINENDGLPVKLYFPMAYRNLTELRIKWFLNMSEINELVEMCSRLELLQYDNGRNEKDAPYQMLPLLASLTKLGKLKVMILKNLYTYISYKQLWLLASLVPLERLEMLNVDTREDDTDWHNRGLLPLIKYIKITSRGYHHHWRDVYPFLRKCPNLIDVDVLGFKETVDFEDTNFSQLERLKMYLCRTPQHLWQILKNTKVKFLEIEKGIVTGKTFHIGNDNVSGVGNNLISIKIPGQPFIDDYVWLKLFRAPQTSFENLQELILSGAVGIYDEFIHLVALKCPQLKKLILVSPEISGNFINRIRNLETLILSFNRGPLLCSHIYSILHDLKALQSFQLDNTLCVNNDDHLPNYRTENLEHFGVSLKILKLCNVECNKEFWQRFVYSAPESFQKVEELHLQEHSNNKDHHHHLYPFIGRFKNLHKVVFSGGKDLNIDPTILYKVNHLTFLNCKLRGRGALTILNRSHVESAIILNTHLTHDPSNDIILKPRPIFKNLNSITLQYRYLKSTLSLWQSLLRERPRFRISCIEHENHIDVLDNLLLCNKQILKRNIEIHVNCDLSKYNVQ